MFYSEALLQKTGALARVWLAANLERKLSKKDALDTDIGTKVRDIMATEQAPLALRLSGQLLLGVVRIHGKQTKYLYEDCTAALTRLKLSQRPGDVDMPANQLLGGNSHALTLPDAITEQDLFALPDPEEFFGGGRDLDNEPSQLLPEITSTPTSVRYTRPTAGLEEEDLGLGLFDDEPSIELGRGDNAALNDETTMLQDDLGLFGDDSTIPNNGDLAMPDAYDDTLLANADRDPTAPTSARDVTFRESTVEEIDETAIQAAQRVKRRKVLRQDVQTELQSAQMKKLQEDRSAITRAPSYLPQDPLLLQLLEAQRSGLFVSSILGDGRMLGLAPELRGVCSIEVIRKTGDKKRKRDSGVADLESSSEKNQASPQLDIPALDDDFINIDGQDEFAQDSMLDQGTGIMSEEEIARIAAQEIDEPTGMDSGFDNTVAPLLHPSQSGPVSVGTKSAVATLRAHLAPGHEDLEPPTPSRRTKAEAKFSELCPIAHTTREAATKMFFELLVLGTKDAVKIEQEKKSGIEGEIRVRGKRGLWGSWAEMSSQQGVLTTL